MRLETGPTEPVTIGTGLPERPVKPAPLAKSICMTSGVEIIPTMIMIVARMPTIMVRNG